MTHTLATFASDAPAHRWREPSRSAATRRPSEKPNAAARPIIVTTEDNRELLCESETEAKAAFVLLARPDCRTLYEQPPAVRYRDLHGIERNHTFDFLMVLRSDARVVVFVKPISINVGRNLRPLILHIAKQMDPAFATGILPMTEARMSRVVVANARLVHDARRLPNPDHDRSVSDAVETLNGAATVATIVALAGLEGHDQGFYAVARAVGAGLIVPTRRGLIDPDMLVRPVRRHADLP